MEQVQEELSDQFGTDGCNDMTFKDTPENSLFISHAEVAFGDRAHDYQPEPHGKNDLLYTNNIVILEFLADKIKKATYNG